MPSTPTLVIQVLEASFEIAKFLTSAILEGDDHVWRPIASILPTPLKSRLERLAQDAKTEAELRKIIKPHSEPS